MNAEQNTSGKAIAIVTAVIGGVALLGSGTGAAVAAVNDVSTFSDLQVADVSGITGVDLDVSGRGMRVELGDVDEAELAVAGDGEGRWTLERDGDELIVHSPDHNFGWWFGSLFNDDEATTVLTLPEKLLDSRIDLDISMGAGRLDVDGDFGDVDVEMGAGALVMNGSAETVEAELSAGRADLDLADVSEASFEISAGQLVAELTGTAPKNVQLDVSAGSLTLTLPDVAYSVQQNVSAGSLDNNLQASTNARNSIVVSLSAGSVVLRPGD